MGSETHSDPASPNLDPGGQIQIFFTTPHQLDANSYHRGGIDESLASSMDGAQQTIDVAAFELDNDAITGAMLHAHQRGVKVRLVVDGDYADEVSVEHIRRAGIPIVTDDRDPFMHNKFVVIDGRQVWTGSWNFTDNGTYRNDNNVVIVQSEKLAANYTQEFEEMFDGQFGPTSLDDTPYPQLKIGEVQVENYFASEGDLPAPILTILEQAESSIYFMVFTFTDNEIAKRMVAKHRAGLTVRGVIEARNVGGTGEDFEEMRKAGIDVLEDGNPYMMHHKVMVVDEHIVVTGSYNFTASAADKNDENVLILHSSEIAVQYIEEFERVYRQAKEAK
ncbi:MAG: DUF1669 domain-containing protein [Anaerolineae bacterium]|nr:DUF1669 domain-containing protein [Anaerolineae bacterium]